MSFNKKPMLVGPKMAQSNCKSKNARLPTKNGSSRVLSGINNRIL